MHSRPRAGPGGPALVPIGRRRAITVLGGGALALLAGCGRDPDAGGDAVPTTTSRAPSPSRAGPANDAPIPEEMAGPYPGDGSNGPDVLTRPGVVRRDIRSSFGSSSTTAEGVPLTIELDVVDGPDGAPLERAAVYVWHCDRDGGYSMYTAGLENENYLRGVQETDTDGRAAFTSVFPGVYEGRWPHVHFAVYADVAAATGGGTPVATSQIALPETACTEVYATAGYEQSARNLALTSLSADAVFGDDGAARQLGTVSGDVAAGYRVALRVPVGTAG